MISQLLACNNSMFGRSKWLEINIFQDNSFLISSSFQQWWMAWKAVLRALCCLILTVIAALVILTTCQIQHACSAWVQRPSVDDLQAIARRDTSGFKLGQLDHGGKRKGNSKPNKEKGEAYPPQPPAYKGEGKPSQLPTRELWCSIGWNKGQGTQACWWNTPQHQKQHQQQQAWYNPSKQQHRTAQALEKRYQHHIYKIDQPAT